MTAPRVLGVVLLLAGSSAPAASTIDATNRHVYGANVGWMDARADGTNGAVIGAFVCSGNLYGANVGWIHLGNGAPTNGVRYGNEAAGDYGVNHDGAGRLSGFAYGANVGWIAFVSNGHPRINLLDGSLDGFAYSANAGWIGLSNSFAFLQTDHLDRGADADGDGIPDAWEYSFTNTLAAFGGPPSDSDGDGVPDLGEYLADTHPNATTSVLEVVSLTRQGGSNEVA